MAEDNKWMLSHVRMPDDNIEVLGYYEDLVNGDEGHVLGYFEDGAFFCSADDEPVSHYVRWWRDLDVPNDRHEEVGV